MWGRARLAWNLWHAALNQPGSAWPAERFVLGHRGARAKAPENTLASFRMAMEQGADGVEFDVLLSRDAVPIVIHDEYLERTTDARGAVADLSAKQLARINAALQPLGFAREGVPTLEETLAALPDGAIANVELKGSGHHPKPLLIDRVLPHLRAHRSRLCLIVSSFDPELLLRLRAVDPHILIGLLFSPRDEYWPRAFRHWPEIRPDALHLPPVLVSPWIVREAKKKNLRVALWTINSGAKAKQYFQWGVDGVISDDPSLILS